MEKESYVTLATSDFFAYGCIVLGHSLRKTGTRRKLVALVTDDVSWSISQTLQSVFDLVERVPKLNLDHVLVQDTLPDLSSLAKIHCWRLTQFSKGVFLNADTLVLQNCDELFERSELSAVPDVGWPDCFNTGVFVFEPSLDTYWSLINLVTQRKHRDGGDQYILNLCFNPDWKTTIQKRLPFIYNLVCSSVYTYAPAFQQFGKRVKIIHFVGHPKPWDSIWKSKDGKITLPGEINFTFQPFYQNWLDIFKNKVLPHLPKSPINEELLSQQMATQDVSSNQVNHPDGTFRKSNGVEEISKSNFRSVSPPFTSHTYNIVIPPIMPSKPKNHISQTAERAEDLVPSVKISLIPKMEVVETKAIPLPDEVKMDMLLTCEMHEEIKPPILQEQSVNFTDNTHEQIEKKAVASCDHENIPSKISPTDIFPEQITDKTEIIDDETRMKQWEEGNIDYLGKDTFDNIWKHLSNVIQQTPTESVSENVTCETCPEAEVVTAETIEGAVAEAGEKSKEEDTTENKLPGYPLDDYTGMFEWEQGRIDYTGKDSSNNIIQRLDFLIKNENYREILKDSKSVTSY